MEALLALVILVILAGPIVALVFALRAQGRANEALGRADAAHRRLDAMERVVRETRAARAAPEAASAAAEPPASPQTAPAAVAPERPVTAPPGAAPPVIPAPPILAAPAGPAPAPEEATPAVDEPSAPPPPFPPPPAPAPSAETPGFDWESLVGVRLFAWLGGAALFIGAALFLQYSIEHGLISPAARVALGLVVGAACVFGGDVVRAKADRAGQALSGAGVAILYASLFAGYSLYKLFDTTVTFAGMGLVTVVAGVLAAVRGAYMLAILGLVGGFATPYLLSTGEDRPVGLFLYVSLLNAGLVAITRKRAWPSLGLLGLVGTTVLFGGWSAKFLDAPRVGWAFLAAALLAALFAFAPWGGGEKLPLGRAVSVLGASAPFLLAVVAGGVSSLRVPPAVLVGFVALLTVGAILVSRRAEAPPLVVVAAIGSVAALLARSGKDLFPAERTTTLLLFLVPAALHLAAAFRARADETAAKVSRAGAAIALLGSFAVPIGVALDVEPRTEPILPLFLFGAALAVGLAILARRARADGFLVAAQGALFLLLLVLTVRDASHRVEEFAVPILAALLFFWAQPLLPSDAAPSRTAWFSSGFAPVLHFALLYAIARQSWDAGTLGALAIACGVLAFLMLRRALALLGDDDADATFAMALFGGVTLLFVSAAIPILLDREWITVGWALEAAALAGLRRRVPHDGLVAGSAVLAGAVFARLVLNPAVWEYHARTGTPILNWYLFTFGVPALAFLVAARLLDAEGAPKFARLPALLRAAAGIVLFVLVNVEVADYFSSGSALTFRFTGGGLAQDMAYSLSWGAYALILFGIGMARRSKAIRLGALVVLVLTVLKVFLHDLWAIGGLFRVGSIVGLAAALLLVSFLLQRFVLRKEEA